MLNEHPHIERIHIHETTINGRWAQKLVVETNLKIPASGNYAENKALQDLADILNLMAAQDFGDFKEIEIKEYRPPVTDARGRDAA